MSTLSYYENISKLTKDFIGIGWIWIGNVKCKSLKCNDVPN